MYAFVGFRFSICIMITLFLRVKNNANCPPRMPGILIFSWSHVLSCLSGWFWYMVFKSTDPGHVVYHPEGLLLNVLHSLFLLGFWYLLLRAYLFSSWMNESFENYLGRRKFEWWWEDWFKFHRSIKLCFHGSGSQNLSALSFLVLDVDGWSMG